MVVLNIVSFLSLLGLELRNSASPRHVEGSGLQSVHLCRLCLPQSILSPRNGTASQPACG